MRSAGAVGVVVLACALASCSWLDGSDDIEPNELIDIENPIRIKQVWKKNLGDGSGDIRLGLVPTVVGDRIAAADHQGDLFMGDAVAGKLDWSIKTDVDFSAGPTIADGRILIGSLEGTIHAYSVEDGTELWASELSSEVLAPPIMHDNMVVVRALDGRVFGLDPETGVRQWVYDRGVPLLTLRGTGRMLARAGIVYFGTDDGKVIALRVADGTVLWEQALTVPAGRTELERLIDIDGRMAIVATDLYVAGYQGRIAAMAADSGRMIWVQDISSHQGLVVSRTHLLVSDDESAVVAVDRRSGGTLWRQDELLNRQITGPEIHGDYVVVGDVEGYLHWLSIEEGVIRGRTRLSRNPIHLPGLTVGDIFYAMDSEGVAGAFRIEEPEADS